MRHKLTVGHLLFLVFFTVISFHSKLLFTKPSKNCGEGFMAYILLCEARWNFNRTLLRLSEPLLNWFIECIEKSVLQVLCLVVITANFMFKNV